MDLQTTIREIHILVQGRVQGVAFRYHTRRIAANLEVCGSVKNLPDGRVEIYAKGSAAKLAKLIAWCTAGSPAASVISINVHYIISTNSSLSSFIIE